MFKKKIISIILIVCVSIGVPLAFCLTSSASSSEVWVEDLYKKDSVEYQLSNPHFEIIDYTNNQRFEFEGEGGGSELGFSFPSASSTGGITDRSTINLGVAGALLGTYTPSYNVYYRFTFDVRVLWTVNELRSKYNLDILASTSVGGCVMVMSNTYSYVEFLDQENEAGEYDSFYYTNTATSAYLPQKSSFDMRLFSVAPNRFRVTVTLRLLQGQPKYNRSIDLQFIINSKEAENAYIPKVEFNQFDDVYKNEDNLFDRLDGDVIENLDNIFDDGIRSNGILRSSLAGVTLVFNNFIVPNSYCMYIIYFGMAIGAVPFILLISKTIITGSHKKE